MITYFDLFQQVLRCCMSHKLGTQVPRMNLLLLPETYVQVQLLVFGRLVQTFVEHQNERTVVYFRDEVSLDVRCQTKFGDVCRFVITACERFCNIRIREHDFKKLSYAIVAVV